MSEIELQIQGNPTQRKHVDDYQAQPLSAEPARDHVGDVVDSVIESRPSTPIMTKMQVKTARMQLLAISWSMFMLGWNDGSLGPLLPKIQEVYHVHKPLCSDVSLMKILRLTLLLLS
jgi:hypothetical protein